MSQRVGCLIELGCLVAVIALAMALDTSFETSQLIVALPIGVFLLVVAWRAAIKHGRRLNVQLSNVDFAREMSARPLLSDDEFYETFYGTTDIPVDIPIRLRKLYAYQLGDAWQKIWPQDVVTKASANLNFADLLAKVEDEFGVTIPREAMQTMDGSFGGIVQYVASCRDDRLADGPENM
jgi:hypothetical protein